MPEVHARAAMSCRPSLWWRAAASAVLLVVAACGARTPSAADRDATGQADGPPLPGGTLTFNDTADALTLDPDKASTIATYQAVSGVVYSKLLDFASGPDQPYGSMSLQGDLAETWSRSADARTWTVQLRHGVRFQDIAPVNGRLFTSADVICTLNRIVALPGVQLSQIAAVESFEAPDPYTVVFHLRAPGPAFDRNLASPYMTMLPCEATNGGFDPATTAIGTGPFILATWERNRRKEYVRNPSYFRAGLPYLDGVTVVTIPDQASAIAAFRTGALDRTSTTGTYVRSVTSTNTDTVVTREATTTSDMLFLNEDHFPLDSPEVRTAIALAIDRAGMAEAFNGEDFQLSGPVPALLEGALPADDAARLAPFDPDRAEDILAAAGFAGGLRLTMITSEAWGSALIDRAQWVQQDLSRVGIDVTIRVLDPARFYSAWQAGDYEIGFASLTGMFTAQEYLDGLYRSDGSRNWFNSNDPTVDSMIARAEAIIDDGQRDAALRDISTYIIKHGPNPLLFYNADTIYLNKPYVHGLYGHPQYARPWLADVWLGADAPGRR